MQVLSDTSFHQPPTHTNTHLISLFHMYEVLESVNFVARKTLLPHWKEKNHKLDFSFYSYMSLFHAV